MRGFIALTSVLIISAVLLVLVAEVGTPVFYARMNLLETERHIESRFLAESCVQEVALRRIAEPEYAGNDMVEVSGTPCAVGTSSVRIDYRGAVTVLPF